MAWVRRVCPAGTPKGGAGAVRERGGANLSGLLSAGFLASLNRPGASCMHCWECLYGSEWRMGGQAVRRSAFGARDRAFSAALTFEAMLLQKPGDLALKGLQALCHEGRVISRHRGRGSQTQGLQGRDREQEHQSGGRARQRIGNMKGGRLKTAGESRARRATRLG